MHGAGVSGCRVSFKISCLASRPVESMPNSAGQFTVQRSARVKGLRLCYTGLGRMVHVLDGSGGCGQNEPLLSSGARAADVAKGERQKEMDIPRGVSSLGPSGPGNSDGHTQAFSFGAIGWTCSDVKAGPEPCHVMRHTLSRKARVGACRVVRLFTPKDVGENGCPTTPEGGPSVLCPVWVGQNRRRTWLGRHGSTMHVTGTPRIAQVPYFLTAASCACGWLFRRWSS